MVHMYEYQIETALMARMRPVINDLRAGAVSYYIDDSVCVRYCCSGVIVIVRADRRVL